MGNIFVWCAALFLHPFCLDYISLGLGNMTENSFFFFILPILMFLILHILKQKKEVTAQRKKLSLNLVVISASTKPLRHATKPSSTHTT